MKLRLVYCSAWNYEPQALSLMGKVLPKFKQRLDEVILVPSDGGRFEISFNDDLIYSKVETGSFPDEDEIVATIEERIEQAVSWQPTRRWVPDQTPSPALETIDHARRTKNGRTIDAAPSLAPCVFSDHPGRFTFSLVWPTVTEPRPTGWRRIVCDRAPSAWARQQLVTNLSEDNVVIGWGRKKRLVDYASCAGWAGKLPQQGMAQVLRGLPTFDDPNLLVGPASFDDAGVYRLGEGLAVVQTVDFFPPLVDDPYTFGRIAAANSLSDVYAMGGEPRTAMNIVGFPDDKLPLEVLVEILRGGAERVAAAGAVIVGGHSVRDVEIKYGLAVTGIVDPAQMVTNAGAKPGDRLVLTKPLGTGFVTTAFKANRCPADTLQTAAESMMALNAAAARVMRDAGIRGGTDITGFGLAGHANELAEASGVAIVLEIGKLPLLPGSEPLAEAGFFTRASKTNRDFVEPVLRREGSLDSIREEYLYDAQTSGGLLMSVPEESVNDVLARLHREGVATACVIGSVAERTNANLVIRP